VPELVNCIHDGPRETGAFGAWFDGHIASLSHRAKGHRNPGPTPRTTGRGYSAIQLLYT
jgi:hypothetical protein